MPQTTFLKPQPYRSHVLVLLLRNDELNGVSLSEEAIGKLGVTVVRGLLNHASEKFFLIEAGVEPLAPVARDINGIFEDGVVMKLDHASDRVVLLGGEVQVVREAKHFEFDFRTGAAQAIGVKADCKSDEHDADEQFAHKLSLFS